MDKFTQWANSLMVSAKQPKRQVKQASAWDSWMGGMLKYATPWYSRAWNAVKGGASRAGNGILDAYDNTVRKVNNMFTPPSPAQREQPQQAQVQPPSASRQSQTSQSNQQQIAGDGMHIRNYEAPDSIVAMSDDTGYIGDKVMQHLEDQWTGIFKKESPESLRTWNKGRMAGMQLASGNTNDGYFSRINNKKLHDEMMRKYNELRKHPERMRDNLEEAGRIFAYAQAAAPQAAHGNAIRSWFKGKAARAAAGLDPTGYIRRYVMPWARQGTRDMTAFIGKDYKDTSGNWFYRNAMKIDAAQNLGTELGTMTLAYGPAGLAKAFGEGLRGWSPVIEMGRDMAVQELPSNSRTAQWLDSGMADAMLDHVATVGSELKLPFSDEINKWISRGLNAIGYTSAAVPIVKDRYLDLKTRMMANPETSAVAQGVIGGDLYDMENNNKRISYIAPSIGTNGAEPMRDDQGNVVKDEAGNPVYETRPYVSDTTADGRTFDLNDYGAEAQMAIRNQQLDPAGRQKHMQSIRSMHASSSYMQERAQALQQFGGDKEQYKQWLTNYARARMKKNSYMPEELLSDPDLPSDVFNEAMENNIKFNVAAVQGRKGFGGKAKEAWKYLTTDSKVYQRQKLVEAMKDPTSRNGIQNMGLCAINRLAMGASITGGDPKLREAGQLSSAEALNTILETADPEMMAAFEERINSLGPEELQAFTRGFKLEAGKSAAYRAKLQRMGDAEACPAADRQRIHAAAMSGRLPQGVTESSLLADAGAKYKKQMLAQMDADSAEFSKLAKSGKLFQTYKNIVSNATADPDKVRALLPEIADMAHSSPGGFSDPKFADFAIDQADKIPWEEVIGGMDNEQFWPYANLLASANPEQSAKLRQKLGNERFEMLQARIRGAITQTAKDRAFSDKRYMHKLIGLWTTANVNPRIGQWISDNPGMFYGLVGVTLFGGVAAMTGMFSGGGSNEQQGQPGAEIQQSQQPNGLSPYRIPMQQQNAGANIGAFQNALQQSLA